MRETAFRVPLRSALHRLVLFGSVFAAAPGVAAAAEPFFAHEEPRYRNGDQLLHDCRSPEPAERARCAGYVMAVADMLGGASASIDGLQACLTGKETLAELVDVVLTHLEANPARASLKGDGVVAYALSLYRPCAESEASFPDRLKKP